MNAISQAQRAYSTASSPIRTTRGTEYDAIARITYKLKTAAAKGPDGFAALVDAMQSNNKMWQIFAIDVADRNNALPKELKAQIFYLAEFTRQHTSKVLARREDVAPLLEINLAILRGLRTGAE
ncbi:MAG: flagellar biosynthesis regulator FlaF [Rhodobacteraceae bacterium]|nr:flagellar biosynthesis regulator FlaF [Paracoccaceae bacterium]